MPAPSELSNETKIADHLGDDPHPDRELGAAEAQDQERERDRDHAAKERRDDHRAEGVDAAVGEPDGGVGAEADEGLQADRHEPAVAGERVPHHRHQDECQ